MRTCDTCGGEVPAGTRGDTCPDCLGLIIANSMIEDEDDGPLCGDDREGLDEDDEPLYDDEHDHLNPMPTEPEDDDLVTSDYMKFYRHGFRHKGPVVECREGERWAHAVLAYMDKGRFWPNVWYIGERGDADLIDMFEALHNEEQ